MKRLFHSSLLIFILFGLTACPEPVLVDPLTLPRYPSVFMYATGEGELRLFNIEYSATDTIYEVERFGNLGTPASFYGEAINDWYNTYDISKYSATDSFPKATAALRKYNTIDPAYNKLYLKQVIGLNQNRRIVALQFFSDLNKRYQAMTHWNYPLYGERSVSFIDQQSYVVLYLDQYEEIPGVDRPADIPYSGRVINLVRYSFTNTNPDLGEIITTFSIGDKRVDVYKDKPTSHGNNVVHVSAKGQFYIVWAPFYNSIPFSPYVIRKDDGSMAFNPVLVQWNYTNRFFGQQMFAFEPSTTKDSIFVIGDAAYRQIKLVQLPPTLGSRFIELKTKSLVHLFPESEVARFPQLQKQRSLFMKFNKTGNRLAITHAMEGVTPELVIWHTDTDSLKRYKVNQPGSDIQYKFMGKAAWAYNSPNLVYFMAADTANNVADIFYVDARKPSGYATKLNWSRVTFRSGVYEDLTSATDLVGR